MVTHWTDVIRQNLTAVVAHYERSAPTVSDWANGLFIRMNETPDAVRLSELAAVESLFNYADGWMGPNVAANVVYKLMHRLGQDTTGHAGF